MKNLKNLLTSRTIGARLVVAIITFVIVASLVTATAYMQGSRREANSKARTSTPSKIFVGAGDSKNSPAATGTCDTGQNIDVEATGGTAQTGYASLNAAFAAINAGTHTGVINIEICASETEPAGSAVLNSSGAGSASYTSINIYPLADGLTISGASVSGRGVLELNGADSVTIDGDNPNTAGINRNLTITNTAAAATTFTQVIRVALSTLISSGNNNTVKNCILNGSATGQNVAAQTATTAAVHTTYGILVGGGASTAAATTAPSAITSVTTTIGTGITATNFTASNNAIDACARGIAVMGSAVSVAPGLTVTNNVIGNASAASTTTVYSRGMTLQGFDTTTISGNTLQNIQSFVGTSIMAIGLGNESSSGTNATVEKNIINNVNARSTGTFGAYGINLAAGAAITVRNNFVSGMTGDMTGGAAFSTTFGIFGIRLASGNNHKIYHNSVNMFGARTGTATTSLLGAALCIVANTQTGIDVRNNVLANTLTGGTTSIAYVSIFLPSAGTSAMNLTENNNAYFFGTDAARQGVGQAGTTAGTNFFTTLTALKAYSSTLSAAGTNDNASIASTSAAPFTSNTDLHIPNGTMTQLESSGAPGTGVTVDIDNETRNATTPDIGADEFNGVFVDLTAPSIAYTPLGNTSSTSNRQLTNVTVTDASGVNTASGTKPRLYYKKSTDPNDATGWKFVEADNSSSPFTFTIDYSQLTGGSVSPGDVIQYFVVAQDLASTPNVAINSGSFAAQPSSVALTASAFPIGGTINSYRVATAFTGSLNVGTTETVTSLTNAGGLFDTLNNNVITGNLTINITSDLTGENGVIALNQLAEEGAGNYTVTIKPSGAPRMITGSSTVGIIRLNDTDRVTIDGSLTGGTATGLGGDPSLRNLTVQNTNTTATAGGVVIVTQGVNGAQNVTIRNVNVTGQDPTQTLIGIGFGGNTPGSSPTVNNNNGRVENCSVQKAFVGVFYNGVSSASPTTGAVITRNDLSATGTNRLRRVGIFFFNQNGILVTENSIGGISTDESADGIGIVAGIQNITTTNVTAGGVTNALIARNKINGIAATSTTGFSAAGIAVAGDVGGGSTIVNNMISGVTAPSTSPDLVAGIFVAGVPGSSTKLYHNSISMTGDRGAVASQIGSYGLAISGSNPTVEVKDNIFYTSQTSGGGATAKSYALGMATAAASATALDANYNDYFISGANAGGFRAGSIDTTGTDFATLGAWQTATSKDANSLSVDPLYVDPLTDLHLQAGSTLINAGTSVGVTDDIDRQTRVFPPDIGADEQAGITVARRQIADFDGENKTDVSVWNPSTHNWTIRDSGTGTTHTVIDWGNGALGDMAVPRDYDGDGKIDVAVWRPSEGNWYVIRSSNNTILLQNWGVPGDIPVPGDYDADGKADFAVMRPSEGNWYILKSSGGGTVQGWGASGDKPVPADYDGDGKTDIAVFRPSEGNWYILSSFSNTGSVRNWGISTDVPVPADYDGDLKADLAIYRNGDWFILRSTNGLSSVKNWGNSSDIAVPGDYDGDGNADIAVFRPSEGNWYILNSTGSNTLFSLGVMGDVPAPSTYHP
jgi:trimeric autotransporter adhesin